jgi:hypothetical protein
MSWQWSKPDWRFEARYVNDLAFLDTVLFAATDGALLSSTDSGATWQRSSLPQGLVKALAILPNQADGINIVVGCSQAVYESADSGATWLQVNAGLPNALFRHFLVLRTQLSSGTSNGLAIFASTNNGAYVSEDYGVNWTDVSAGLTIKNVGDLTASDTYLFAATPGGVVWRRRLSEMVTSAKRQIDEVPEGFHLRQNYPNPFNPTTTLEFDVPRTSRVRILVYDLLGRQVARVLDAVKEPGRHRTNFNAEGLAAGVYLLRMHAESYSESRKIVLLH